MLTPIDSGRKTASIYSTEWLLRTRSRPNFALWLRFNSNALYSPKQPSQFLILSSFCLLIRHQIRFIRAILPLPTRIRIYAFPIYAYDISQFIFLIIFIRTRFGKYDIHTYRVSPTYATRADYLSSKYVRRHLITSSSANRALRNWPRNWEQRPASRSSTSTCTHRTCIHAYIGIRTSTSVWWYDMHTCIAYTYLQYSSAAGIQRIHNRTYVHAYIITSIYATK